MHATARLLLNFAIMAPIQKFDFQGFPYFVLIQSKLLKIFN